MEKKLKTYLEQVTGQASVRQISMAIDMPQTTLAYQWRGNIQPSTLAAICRTYGAPILQAFVIAGFITQDDADNVTSVRGLREVSDEELAEEVLRRMNAGRHPALEDPYPDNVTRLDSKRGADDYGAEDDLEGVARKIDDPKYGDSED